MKLLFFAALAALLGAGAAPLALADDAAATAATIAEGREIAFRRKGASGVGNCLACHVIAGGESPGNMGPPLRGMKARFPNREDLRARLYDATRFNPISAMPPFGKHGILTDAEIDKLIDYLYTL